MKKMMMKFRSIPSYARTLPVAVGAMVASGLSHAGAVATAAAAPLATAQADGESTGGLVVGVVCALAVVGVIIALVRKV